MPRGQVNENWRGQKIDSGAIRDSDMPQPLSCWLFFVTFGALFGWAGFALLVWATLTGHHL